MNRQKQMQKALNHVNKAITRIDMLTDDAIALDRMEASKPWFYLGWDLAGYRSRLLVQAWEEGIELDVDGLPKPNRRNDA